MVTGLKKIYEIIFQMKSKCYMLLKEDIQVALSKRFMLKEIMHVQVASWGGDLLDRGILTVSLAPRDNHQAQVQFALERGIPAILGIISTQRLPFPANSLDMAHCSRCLIPWTEFGILSSLDALVINKVTKLLEIIRGKSFDNILAVSFHEYKPLIIFLKMYKN